MQNALVHRTDDAERAHWGVLLLDGHGGATILSWQALERWEPAQGPLWIHLDPNDAGATRWLREQSGLADEVVSELLGDDLQPRIEELADGAIFAALRGLASDLESGSSPRTQLHLWGDGARVITLCPRALPGVTALKARYASGRGPVDLPGLVVSLVGELSATLRSGAAEIEAPLAELEYAAELGSTDTAEGVRQLRGRVTALRRVLATLKVLLDRALALDGSWLMQSRHKEWRRLADEVRQTEALLQSAYERLHAVHDYVGERLNRTMNDVLYRLTIFSTILLPITAITSVLGMNVGVPGASYRFMSGPLTFAVIVVLLIALGWVEYRFMQKRKLLPRSALPAVREPRPSRPSGRSKGSPPWQAGVPPSVPTAAAGHSR